MSETEQVEGIVASVNEKGVKLEGHEGWINYTQEQWRKEPWDKHERGDHVKLALNKGWVYAIKRLSTAPTNGAAPTTYAERDDHIARAVALKAAVDFSVKHDTNATAEAVILNAEFFLTFLQPSEPPQDQGDPGPEDPFA